MIGKIKHKLSASASVYGVYRCGGGGSSSSQWTRVVYALELLRLIPVVCDRECGKIRGFRSGTHPVTDTQARVLAWLRIRRQPSIFSLVVHSREGGKTSLVVACLSSSHDFASVSPSILGRWQEPATTSSRVRWTTRMTTASGVAATAEANIGSTIDDVDNS